MRNLERMAFMWGNSTNWGPANNLLIDTFSKMKEVYDDNADEYVDLPYAFYESEFVPFIVSQLQNGNRSELDKIFSFVEKLFVEGDEMIVNLAGVAIVESLFFEKNYDNYKNVILDLCGEQTCKSLNECVS